MTQSSAALDYSSTASVGTRSSPDFKVHSFEGGIFIEDVWARWGEDVTRELEDLVRLPHGWDGYQAEPVSFTNAAFALQMLDKVCGPRAATPAIVPGVAGDLQIEWHTELGDIELHVRAPNDVEAWCLRAADDNSDGEEKELKNNFSIVASWVRDIAE